VNDPSGNMEMTMASIYATVACRLLQPKAADFLYDSER
jgi:hypothetical protein